jgi:hypothetical protein
LNYLLPLDQASSEVIVAPFHDPEHSHWISVGIESSTGHELTRDTLWDSTPFYWARSEQPLDATLRIACAIDMDSFDEVMICVSVPKTATIRVSLLGPDALPLGVWSEPMKGIAQREEYVFKLKDLLPPPPRPTGLLRRVPKVPKIGSFAGIAVRLECGGTQVGVMSFNWIGLRNSSVNRAIKEQRAKLRPDWSPWILPDEYWGEISFERGLLFDVGQLDAVRAKLADPAWRAHFDLLEARAAEYLLRVPEDDFGDYLPNHDARYIRKEQLGKTCYHWEGLVLAFVGLVKNDRALICHALRYLMCMVHTPFWTESGEHNIPSSTWSHRSFLEEMTTTSVSILFDWLGFALFPRTKILIRKALSERGMVKVARDLSSRAQMHEMNQGAVFNRALVLGGLMLEQGWPLYGEREVDAAYATMVKVLDHYVQPDGGVHEGIGYLCQTMTATLWAIIAYSRARGLDWEQETLKRFASTGRYVAAMAASDPGKAIPAGDCRVEWFGGDAIPIMAALDPNSSFAAILGSCLRSGMVHELTGTLAKSGGLIGMVYGPDSVPADRNPVVDFDFLPSSAKVTMTLATAGQPVKRLWISGGALGASHSHRDVGQFVLEIDSQPVFVDRGMVQYWHAEAHLLSRAWLHNVLTPISADGDFLNQAPPVGAEPMVVSADRAGVQVPGNGVWKDAGFTDYARNFRIGDGDAIEVVDTASISTPTEVAFHLHARRPFDVDGTTVRSTEGGQNIALQFPWAKSVTCAPMLGDFASRPIYHICAKSDLVSGEISLPTTIRVTGS